MEDENDTKRPNSDSVRARTQKAIGSLAGSIVDVATRAKEQVKKARDNPQAAAQEAKAASEELWKSSAAAVNHAWANRAEAPQMGKGLIRGFKDAMGGLVGHIAGRESEIEIRLYLLTLQANLYRQSRLTARETEQRATRDKELLLDTLFLGGASLASYVSSGQIPAEIQRAYELQYPHQAAHHSLAEEVHRLNPHDLIGLVSGIKGKLFELQYLDFLNLDGHLPDGYHAVLAESATQPGWDIKVTGPDEHIARLIQLKATDSTGYVKHALDVYPHIDVTTTSEVQSHLLMQGMSERVVDSGISNEELTKHVAGALDNAALHIHLGPPIIALAFVAWSSFRREDLEIYDKARNMGDRGTQSWLAYLAGGVVAVATQTWWLSILGSIGSRVFLAAGRAKFSRLDQLDDLIRQNRSVLTEMVEQPA